MSLEEHLTTFKEIVVDLETLEVRCNILKITFLSRPDSRSDSIGESEPVSGCEAI